MPIYEYRCTRCSHQFEVTHAVGQAIERCERCGGPVRRMYSSVGIIFKGPGFHVTDYRKPAASPDGPGKAAAGETPAPAPQKGGDRAAAPSAGGGATP